MQIIDLWSIDELHALKGIIAWNRPTLEYD